MSIKFNNPWMPHAIAAHAAARESLAGARVADVDFLARFDMGEFADAEAADRAVKIVAFWLPVVRARPAVASDACDSMARLLERVALRARAMRGQSLNAREAATLLGVSEVRVGQLAAQGKLPGKRQGGWVLDPEPILRRANLCEVCRAIPTDTPCLHRRRS